MSVHSGEFPDQLSAADRSNVAFRERFDSLSRNDQLRTICRLIYIDELDQGEVALVTGLSQAAISRALKQARQQRMIRFELVPEPHQADEEQLRYALAMRGVRRVSVVSRDPDPTGKNLGNLSQRAAGMLLSLILDPMLGAGTDDNPVNVVLSCGETVKEILKVFIELLQTEHDRAKEVKSRTINFFPATLWCGKNYELDEAYPHTLVTLLFSSLSNSFHKMHFFAPTLPRAYYKQETPKGRADFLKDHELDKILNAAKKAHIIITGIGTTSGKGFKHAHEVAGEEALFATSDPLNKEELPPDLPEVCYQPINEAGEIFSERYRVVGISLEDLKAAAGHPSDPLAQTIPETDHQHVIAVAGGAAKAVAIAKALRIRQLPFNTLITDPDVVDALFNRTIRSSLT